MRKRQLLKKFGNDEKLKKWWIGLVDWTEQFPLEPSEQSEPQTAPTEEDFTFLNEVQEHAQYMWYLNGQVTISNRNSTIMR